jgi:alcohol dehydrogenase, propanol-preferring
VRIREQGRPLVPRTMRFPDRAKKIAPMRAMLLERPGRGPSQLRAVDALDVEPASGEIAVEVTACGVCRTDLQLCRGDLAPHRLPIVPGHQAVGRVAAIGAGVSRWRIGDRVGVGWLAQACGQCAHCLRGRENLCAHATFTGWDRDGGYATRLLARADFALALPENFDDTNAAPLLCGGVIGYRALLLSGIQRGGRLGLYGFGASALIAIQVARYWGCDVYVCTRSEREQRRARDLGARWAGGYDAYPPVPLDAAVTFAPSGDVVVAALRALERGGTVAVNAIHLDGIPQFSYDHLWWERSLKSVANFTRSDARALLTLAGEIPIHTVFETHRVDQAAAVLDRLEAGEIDGAAVLATN